MAIDEARGVLGRARGLLGRRGLAPGEGLLLRTRSVHTWFMRFPLELTWHAVDGRVLRVDPHVPPWRVRSCRGAAWVVERDARVRGTDVRLRT